MKKWLLPIVSFTVFVAVGAFVITAYQGSRDYRPTPFLEPENLAQKIANFVVANDGNPSYYHYFSNKDKPTTQGTVFRRNVYAVNVIYTIRVGIYKDGQKTLDIWRYHTNWNFDRINSPVDIIAEEIAMGRAETILRTFIYDEGIVQKAYSFRACWKPGKYGSLKGFTAEDLNLDPKRSGIREFTFSDGEVERDGKLVKASEKEISEIQANYNGYLDEIAQCLNIK